ncbi:MAG: transcriptional regulator PpsR [Burkholderiales bacterium]|nr:transcriptional regulator PpsR [Burkholderiales bacterium]
MIGTNVPQPDITLHLDMDGVIRDATLSQAFPHEDLDHWVGRPWFETVSGVGSDKVKRLVEDARWLRVTGFRQINQRFPSGREILVEYATIRLGERDGLIAIGRNLQAVAELQARLVEAQQSMERKYWQLREVETRYRHLFDNADEPVLLVRAANLRILEANPAAMRALRAEGGEGRVVLGEVAAEDREAFQAMLARARAHGKSTGILVRLGVHRELWLVRASLMNSDTGDLFLLQLARAGASGPPKHAEDRIPVEDLIDRGPDAFVVTDGERTILRSNRAFLELVRMSGEEPAIGSRIDRWLSPASDLDALIAAVRREGRVRNHAASVQLASGHEVPVQISAVGSSDNDPHYFGLLLREAGA